ncbi:hypothetical protein OsJ_18643 [Oryza sativa Japonica Group]|nr:hypothetical protein OsJ_18643 [Oryza sativa Japonica Group]
MARPCDTAGSYARATATSQSPWKGHQVEGVQHLAQFILVVVDIAKHVHWLLRELGEMGHRTCAIFRNHCILWRPAKVMQVSGLRSNNILMSFRASVVNHVGQLKSPAASCDRCTPGSRLGTVARRRAIEDDATGLEVGLGAIVATRRARRGQCTSACHKRCGGARRGAHGSRLC